MKKIRFLRGLREQFKTFFPAEMIEEKIIVTQRTGWKENISTIRKENKKETIEVSGKSIPIGLRTEKKNDDERRNHCA